jgi:hypothetical protein
MKRQSINKFYVNHIKNKVASSSSNVALGKRMSPSNSFRKAKMATKIIKNSVVELRSTIHYY